MDHLHYARHFLLLACFSILLGVMSRLRLSMDFLASFALYGALHATALVLALRARQPFWRYGLFIALAAALSAMTLRAGLFAVQLSGALSGYVTLYAVFGFSALTGAAAYGVLIRSVGIFKLTLSELALICCGCTVAADVAYAALAQSPSLGPWGLAVPWWFAFSGGLWYCDLQRRTIVDRSGTGR